MNCLIPIGKPLENLDKQLILDEILPFFQQIQNPEPTIMAIIGKSKFPENLKFLCLAPKYILHLLLWSSSKIYTKHSCLMLW